jgi:hypothetical protein
VPSVRVPRERSSGELGPEETKEFRDTGKYGGEEHTEKGAECAERSSQIHVQVVSAENGGKHLSRPRPVLLQGVIGGLAQPTRSARWSRRFGREITVGGSQTPQAWSCW